MGAKIWNSTYTKIEKCFLKEVQQKAQQYIASKRWKAFLLQTCLV